MRKLLLTMCIALLILFVILVFIGVSLEKIGILYIALIIMFSIMLLFMPRNKHTKWGGQLNAQRWSPMVGCPADHFSGTDHGKIFISFRCHAVISHMDRKNRSDKLIYLYSGTPGSGKACIQPISCTGGFVPGNLWLQILHSGGRTAERIRIICT